MLFNFKSDIINELNKIRLNLEHLYIIEVIISGLDSSNLDQNLLKTLQRKGYLYEDNSITDLGKFLYETLTNPDFISTNIDIKKKVKESKPNIKTDFEEFWKKFPTSDGWGNYPVTRALKIKKEECEEEFAKAINTGLSPRNIDSNKPGNKISIKENDVYSFLFNEIEMKKKASKKTGQNKMSFFVNSLSWFKQKGYLAYLEIAKKANWQPDNLEDMSMTNNEISI